MSREIDSLKSAGKPFEAGQLAFETGRDRSYGCHFGMRSDRDAYARAFERGWDTAAQAARIAKLQD